MTLDRKLLSVQTIKDNIAILESIEPDDAGYYLQLEHEKFVLSALEKQIPKKPIWDMGWVCPNCKDGEILHFPKRPDWDDLFCKRCGQALDWSEDE